MALGYKAMKIDKNKSKYLTSGEWSKTSELGDANPIQVHFTESWSCQERLEALGWSKKNSLDEKQLLKETYFSSVFITFKI